MRWYKSTSIWTIFFVFKTSNVLIMQIKCETWHLVTIRKYQFLVVMCDLVCWYMPIWTNPCFIDSNCTVLQMLAAKSSNSTSLGDIEDIIHNFLIIMLEHSMRQKDGWKVISLIFSYQFHGFWVILMHIHFVVIIMMTLILCHTVIWLIEQCHVFCNLELGYSHLH